MIIDLFADKALPQKTAKAITDETKRVVRELEKTKLLFNEAVDPYEIEAIIYKMKALEMHYAFLVKEAKLGRVSCKEFFGGNEL